MIYVLKKVLQAAGGYAQIFTIFGLSQNFHFNK